MHYYSNVCYATNETFLIVNWPMQTSIFIPSHTIHLPPSRWARFPSCISHPQFWSMCVMLQSPHQRVCTNIIRIIYWDFILHALLLYCFLTFSNSFVALRSLTHIYSHYSPIYLLCDNSSLILPYITNIWHLNVVCRFCTTYTKKCRFLPKFKCNYSHIFF